LNLSSQSALGVINTLRNLSAFVGEVFNHAVVKTSKGFFRNNPHQDGYPDLLAMDEFGKREWEKVAHRDREKEPFSPFPGYGVEVKATCGDIKPAKWFTQHGLEKPNIGDQRSKYVTGYNWKAHHRETNNLCGLIWDFLDGKPTIVAMMYSSSLTEESWGKTVTPKDGGGRTTSVSIMNKLGVGQMYAGLIGITADKEYAGRLHSRLGKY
jgi:hypothetical protein